MPRQLVQPCARRELFKRALASPSNSMLRRLLRAWTMRNTDWQPFGVLVKQVKDGADPNRMDSQEVWDFWRQSDIPETVGIKARSDRRQQKAWDRLAKAFPPVISSVLQSPLTLEATLNV